MVFPWKYGAYLPTLSLSCYSAVFPIVVQETGLAVVVVIWSPLSWLDRTNQEWLFQGTRWSFCWYWCYCYLLFRLLRDGFRVFESCEPIWMWVNVFFLYSCFRQLGGKIVKFWRRPFIVVFAVGDYRESSSIKRRKENCAWNLGRDEWKNRQELVQIGVW